MNQKIRSELFSLSDERYQLFSSKLVAKTDNILGVRLPILRKIAKRITKDDWRRFLKNAKDDYFEEVMLQGMVIGYANAELEEILGFINIFVPKIDNWSICDSFCASLKITNNYKDEMWHFLKKYLKSDKEFEIRFGVVMLLTYFVDKKYIKRAFEYFDEIQHENYYVKMAVAWAVSTYYTKLPDETMLYLKNNSLDDFTYNKALQKICESLIPSEEEKIIIRKMKRKQREDSLKIKS